jgi:hypothetical protein
MTFMNTLAPTEAMSGDRQRRDHLAAVKEANGTSQDDRRVVPFGPAC